MKKARRQQDEMKRVNREAAEERARQQQQFTVEERQAEIQRQIEEFDRCQSSQNSEISEEGKDYE